MGPSQCWHPSPCLSFAMGVLVSSPCSAVLQPYLATAACLAMLFDLSPALPPLPCLAITTLHLFTATGPDQGEPCSRLASPWPAGWLPGLTSDLPANQELGLSDDPRYHLRLALPVCCREYGRDQWGQGARDQQRHQGGRAQLHSMQEDLFARR